MTTAFAVAGIAYAACLTLFFCASLLLNWEWPARYIDWGDTIKGGFIAGTGFFIMSGILVGAVAIIINLTVGA